MLWWAFAGFFFWLSMREIYYGFVARKGYDRPNKNISKPFVVTTFLIGMMFAYMPVRYWLFERFLTKNAIVLSESNKATVHCNTMFDAFFDSQVFASGHAQIETGQIVIQHPWCASLMDHLDHPEKLTREGVFSLHVFVHETMHIRGERNEAITECQAIQRHARAAKLLGISNTRIAKESGMLYFRQDYQNRASSGAMSSMYFSEECAPEKSLDEKLPDSTWN